jgi:hypothetical protein
LGQGIFRRQPLVIAAATFFCVLDGLSFRAARASLRACGRHVSSASLFRTLPLAFPPVQARTGFSARPRIRIKFWRFVLFVVFHRARPRAPEERKEATRRGVAFRLAGLSLRVRYIALSFTTLSPAPGSTISAARAAHNSSARRFSWRYEWRS